MSILAQTCQVVIGIDTHVATHTAAVIDTTTGGVRQVITVAATPDGYTELLTAVEDHGDLRAWAMEGTNSYGAGLARVLSEAGELVIEVERPHRPKRRHGVKTDEADAVRAARDALSRDDLGQPRQGSTDRALMQVMVSARRAAVQAAGDARRQLFSFIVTAPDVVRARFTGTTSATRIRTAASLRINKSWTRHEQDYATVLKTVAHRALQLTGEANAYEKKITDLVRSWRPDLLAEPGVGPITAAVVLCAWSHAGRFRRESAFAMLAGVAPLPANSGQTTNRYRLSRRGDRQLNCALHTIALSRAKTHAPTQAYIARRTTQGKTDREIRRVLKRYIARHLFRLLDHDPAHQTRSPLDNP